MLMVGYGCEKGNAVVIIIHVFRGMSTDIAVRYIFMYHSIFWLLLAPLNNDGSLRIELIIQYKKTVFFYL